MSVAAAGQIAWYLNIAATLGLLVHLSLNGLSRIYWVFCLFLLADLVESAVMLSLHRPHQLAYVYLGGQTLEMILAVFVVLDLYRLALAGQPAMARYGRRTVAIVLLTSFVASGLMQLVLPIVGSVNPGQSPVLYYFYAFERDMDSALVFFLVLISVFMTWFPVRIPKNVALYIGGFVAYFLARWGTILVLTLRRDLVGAMTLLGQSLTLVCLVAWAVQLRKTGEIESTVIGHRWDPAEAERLGGQLTALNAKLERLSGKA